MAVAIQSICKVVRIGCIFETSHKINQESLVVTKEERDLSQVHNIKHESVTQCAKVASKAIQITYSD